MFHCNSCHCKNVKGIINGDDCKEFIFDCVLKIRIFIGWKNLKDKVGLFSHAYFYTTVEKDRPDQILDIEVFL